MGDFEADVKVLGLGKGDAGLGVSVEEGGTGAGEDIDGVGAGETLVLEERHRKNARRSTRTATTAIHTYRGPLLNDERGAEADMVLVEAGNLPVGPDAGLEDMELGEETLGAYSPP